MPIDFTPRGTVRSTLGESPVYDAGRNVLWYCDITEHAVRRFDLGNSETHSWSFPTDVGSLGLTESGRLVIALRDEVGIWDPADETWRGLVEIEKGNKETRLNDGKVGPDGAFWVGTMDDSDRSVKEPIGSLYRVTADGKAEKKVDGIIVSNGLGWSPDDKTFYFADTPRQQVYAYDFDLESGEIANRRIFVTLPEAEGKPDGLTVDAEGFVWVAHWDGWCVTRYDPEGKVERVVNLPVPRPTSCVFGGADMQTLFVTSARIRLSAAQLAEAPLSGSIFSIDTGIKGLPETVFGG